MKKQICNSIYWVGSLEWSKSNFHGHELSIRHGTSYNSYFIDDEKKVLIDLVRVSHIQELIAHIEEFVKIEDLDILIINHAEPDHTSALPEIIARNPNIEIYCSRGGKISIGRHHPGIVQNLKLVKTGDSINIGKRNLKFFEAQMLHWPDSMFTYCPEENILFSTDAFGQHFASQERFTDQIDQKGLWFEAQKYFACILTPFSGQIIKKIEEFSALNWEISIIAPAHGLCWRENPMQIIEKYLFWSKSEDCKDAVIVFDTIWGGTEAMARAIANGLEEGGVSYRMFNAGGADMHDAMADILRYKAVILGSPTQNNSILPHIAAYIEELHGLKFRNKIGMAFGTYGWSGECIKRLEAGLQSAGIEIAHEGIRCQFKASPDDLQRCVEAGKAIAEKIK